MGDPGPYQIAFGVGRKKGLTTMFAFTVAICLLPFIALTAADLLVETTDPKQLKDMGILIRQ